MESILIAVFILGYLLITLEHPLRLDKTVTALIMAAALWGLLAIGFHAGWLEIIGVSKEAFSFAAGNGAGQEAFDSTLLHHLAAISEILIFLICAMTIVEIMDLHRAFSVVQDFVSTKSYTRLLWIVGTLSFFLSSVIDNLTTTIIMVSLLRTLIPEQERRIWYAGMVVIAANAGGAWSPIGDVTTTMLWIAGKVTALGLMEHLIIPSLACFMVPFGIASIFLKAFKGQSEFKTNEDEEEMSLLSSRTMFYLGLGAIIFVPFFKTATHLPPYIGMILALGVVWLVSEYITPHENITETEKNLYSAKRALERIEMSSILFFLGILLSVSALVTVSYGTIAGGEKVGTLRYFSEVLHTAIPSREITSTLIGVASAVVDNVPLVAATLGMFSDPVDDRLWHLLAFTTGTGGSLLIIGSAAGVAAMGMEKIRFGWYLKNIGWLAALGFFAGIIAFILLKPAGG
jgi:Na+/H+ antiporter NhaD/arsenite permease-like protein